MAGEEEQQDARKELSEADESEIERSSGEAVDLPGHADGLHFGGARGEKPSRQVVAEVTVSERGAAGRGRGQAAIFTQRQRDTEQTNEISASRRLLVRLSLPVGSARPVF